jgi:hypothetical protein
MPLPEEPEPGWYATRFSRGGPFVATRIVLDDGLWSLFVGGELVASHTEPWAIGAMHVVAFSRKKLTPEEYASMLAAADAALPDDPLANAAAPVDLRQAPPLYIRKSK